MSNIIRFPIERTNGPLRAKDEKPVVPAAPTLPHEKTREEAGGARYDAKLRRKDITKLLREEVKAGKKAGTFPESLKVSIRKTARGRSIYVTVTAVDVPVFNLKNIEWNAANPHQNAHFYAPEECRDRYSVEMRAILTKLEAMAQSYNYDRSDVMSDYFDTNFYLNVSVDWEMEKAEREKIGVAL